MAADSPKITVDGKKVLELEFHFMTEEMMWIRFVTEDGKFESYVFKGGV